MGRCALKPTTQAEYDALFVGFYGEACAAHVEAYHLHRSLELSRYCDFWNNYHSRPRYVQDKDAIYAYRDGVTREGKPTGQITWRKP